MTALALLDALILIAWLLAIYRSRDRRATGRIMARAFGAGLLIVAVIGFALHAQLAFIGPRASAAALLCAAVAGLIHAERDRA